MVLRPSLRLRARRVQPGHDDHVYGPERLPELLPCWTAHGPARGDVGVDPVVSQAVLGQDAALGGQPALSLRLGDPDVAEDCWVHGDIC